MKIINGIARRCRIDLYTEAEKAIWAAISAVESAGAHPLLTDAVVLLAQAKEKVADHAELGNLWQCPVCQHVMTEEQSKGYRGCAGVRTKHNIHIAQHELL